MGFKLNVEHHRTLMHRTTKFGMHLEHPSSKILAPLLRSDTVTDAVATKHKPRARTLVH